MAVSRQVDLLEPINLADHLDKVELYLGQVCAIAGISKMQLDYWTNKAQIPTKGKKQRIYDIDALETVMLIKQAKDKGLNLGAAIEAARTFREQHPDEHCPERSAVRVQRAARRRSAARARAGSRRAAAPAAHSLPVSSRSDVVGLTVSAGSSACRLVDVDPDPEHDAARRSPRPGFPRSCGPRPGRRSDGSARAATPLLAQRCGDGFAGDERELRPDRHRQRRDGAGPRREALAPARPPSPPEPAAALRSGGRSRRSLPRARPGRAAAASTRTPRRSGTAGRGAPAAAARQRRRRDPTTRT